MDWRWIEQLVELGAKYNWVQIFENKGAVMGCSNPHPHCQIWASTFIPNEGRIKDIHQREYFQRHKRPMLLDYVNAELEKQVTKEINKKNRNISFQSGSVIGETSLNQVR